MSRVDPPSGRPRSRRARRDRQGKKPLPGQQGVYEERNLVEKEGDAGPRADPKLPETRRGGDSLESSQGVYEERDLVEKEGEPSSRADPEGLTTHESTFSIGQWFSWTMVSSTQTRSLTETAIALLMITLATTLPTAVVALIAAWVGAPALAITIAATVIFVTIIGVAIYLSTPSRRS